MSEELLKFWIWLQNAAQQAAIAEAPSVMTAAGQKINRNTGKVEYNHANDKDVKQLRSNLAAIGEAGASAPGTAEAIELGYNIVRHPKQTYNFLRNVASGDWIYQIPEDASMAYRRMGPLERDWLMEGNQLSTRSTNALTEAEEKAALTDPKYNFTTKDGITFNFFKAGAEHGGRKQFAKGQPWKGNTVTHGKEQVLAMPGKDLPWVSGKHYTGPQGHGQRVGNISFEDAPFGSHIDLLTKDGFSGINPSTIDGSVIYSPYNLFGRDFGYKILRPVKK